MTSWEQLVATVSDVINRAREILLDTRAASYRYSDDRIVAALNVAVVEVRRLRPDLLYTGLRTDAPRYSSAAPTDVIAIDDMYYPALVDYVAGHISLSDDEFVTDGRAAALLARFTQRLVGKGA